jgi:hypothetical protein
MWDYLAIIVALGAFVAIIVGDLIGARVIKT